MHRLRQQLGVVVFLAGLQLLPPLEEGPQGGIWLLGDDTLVPVRPNLQADQRHTDVQSPIELHTHTQVCLVISSNNTVWSHKAISLQSPLKGC